MSGQVSESQIYLFLADYGSNWRADADKLDREDGNVTKYEFKKFIAEEMDGWNGVDISKLSHSVIDNFFAKLDTNDVGSNFNKLDSNELEKMESNVKAYQILNDYIADKFKNDYPSDILDVKYGNSWKWELSDGLTPVIEQCISEKNTDEAAIKAVLDNLYPQSCALATAQCCAAQYTGDNSNIKNLLNDLSSNYGYKITDDKDLSKIIKNWIENNLSASMDANAINNGVKAIVDGYLATAGLGNGNPDAVKDLGYNPAKLNEIQKAQLNKVVKTALYGNIDYNITDRDGNTIDLGAYSEQYSQAVEVFVANYQIPSDVTATEGMSQFEATLNSIRTNIKTQFENSDAFKKLKNSILLEETYLGVNQNSGFIQFLKSKGMTDEQINDLLPKISNPETCKTEYPEYYKEYCEIMESIKKGEPTYLNDNGTINYGAIDLKLLTLFQPEIDAEIAKQAATLKWEDLPKNDSTTYNIRYIDNSTGIEYFSDIYAQNKRIDLITTGNLYDKYGWHKDTDWKSAVANAKGNLANFVTSLASACASTGKYNAAALETAKNKVITIYNLAFDQSIDGTHWADGGSGRGTSQWSVNYCGENYTYVVDKSKKGATSDQDVYKYSSNLGLRIQESTNSPTTFKIHVQAKDVMDLFAKFYQEALG